MILTNKSSLTISLVGLLAFTNACNLTPEPLTKEEIISYLYKDRTGAFDNIEPINKPLTLFDAVARAIKYNLQYRIKVSEAAIGLIEQKAISYEMLPDLIGNINYVNISNDRALASPVSGDTSTARNRDTWYYDMNLSWNILDFGISYYNSKQKANEYLMLEEKKRTMIQEIVRDTRTAYWASHVSNIIQPQVEKLTSELNDAIAKSKKQEEEKLIKKEDAALFRIQLWETTSEINKMKHNLERASHAFSALINVPTYMTVPLDADYKYKVQKLHLPYDIRELELLALHNRPEIREEVLQHRIEVDEIYKARLKLIPNFTLVLGGNYDGTTYLVDQFWREISVRLTWNILKLFSRYYELERAKSAEKLGHVRRQALAVSILTQINVAYARLKEAEINHGVVKGLYNDRLTIYKNAQKRAISDLSSELDIIKAKISYIEAKFKLLTAHYDRINAYNELLDAIGYNSINRVTSLNQSLDQISKQVKRSFDSGEGFYISYNDIIKKYKGHDMLKTFGRKKLIDELNPDEGIDPQILREQKMVENQATNTKTDISEIDKIQLKPKAKQEKQTKVNNNHETQTSTVRVLNKNKQAS